MPSSALYPEDFLDKSIANAVDAVVEVDSRVGVVRPNFDLLAHFDGSYRVLQIDDTVLGGQPADRYAGNVLDGGNAALAAQGFESGVSDDPFSISFADNRSENAKRDTEIGASGVVGIHQQIGARLNFGYSGIAPGNGVGSRTTHTNDLDRNSIRLQARFRRH